MAAAALALFAGLLASAPGAAPLPSCGPGADNVRLVGAQAINEFTYRAALGLPARAAPEPSEAERLADRLRAFLREAGYELARVQSRIEGGCVILELDEGRLDKIVVRDLGSLRSLALRLEVYLPFNVFNRPYLDQLLVQLSAKYRFKSSRYELVPVGEGPSSELPEALQGIDGISVLTPPAGRWELHLFFEQETFRPGFAVGVGIGPPDGVRLGAALRGKSLLAPDDRWQTQLRLGTRFDTVAGIPLSRLDGGVTYSAPPLLVPGLRPTLSAGAELLGRHREDIGLDGFFAVRVAAQLGLAKTFSERLQLSLSGGVDLRSTFELVPLDPLAPFTLRQPSREARFFAEASLDVLFDPSELRRDRRHQASLSVRYFAPTEGQDELLVATLREQKVFNFGWNELRIGATAVTMAGDPLFTDEEPLSSDFVRGVFADRYWVTQAASLGVELRVSLFRDLYKISLFHDLAVFGDRTMSRERPGVGVANAFGLGFHVLLVDTLALDLYYGVGLDHRGDADTGFSASLRQAF
jgi:hypothetical protein